MNVPGGALRFNHIDWEVQMWKGVPPRTPSFGLCFGDRSCTLSPSPGTQLCSIPLALPSPQEWPLIQSIQAKPGTQPLSSIKNASDMTAESQWIQLYEPVGVVSSDNGNWRHLRHLSNGKNFFKECMNPRFKAIVQIVRDHGVECVNCSICDSSMYVME